MTIFYPASPIEIRDGTFDRLSAAKGALGIANVFKARTMPTKDDQLPVVCVWHAGERTAPNGDANVGAPEFEHTLTFVVDIVMTAGTEASLDTGIVGMVEGIRSLLLTDPDWIALFEGIERCDTRYSYPKEAGDFFVQALIEFEVTYRSIWEPIVPNALTSVDVKTIAPHAGVEMTIDLPQN